MVDRDLVGVVVTDKYLVAVVAKCMVLVRVVDKVHAENKHHVGVVDRALAGVPGTNLEEFVGVEHQVN